MNETYHTVYVSKTMKQDTMNNKNLSNMNEQVNPINAVLSR